MEWDSFHRVTATVYTVTKLSIRSSVLQESIMETSTESSCNFWVCGWNPMVLPFKPNLFSSSFTWYYLLCMYSSSKSWTCGWNPTWCNHSIETSPFGLYVLLSCESVNEILLRDHSNENSLSSTFTWCYLIVCGSNFWICGRNPMGVTILIIKPLLTSLRPP